jgi:hypothetical protein
MVLPKLTVGRSDDLPKDSFGLIRSREKTLQQFKRQGPTAQQAPLKLLFIPALPENLPERSKLLEIEQRKIIEAVRGLETTGNERPKLVMEILDSADLNEIEKALEARSRDIVHISGLGAYVADVKHGILHLEDENGDERKTADSSLKCNKLGRKHGFEVFVGGGIVHPVLAWPVIDPILVAFCLLMAYLRKVHLFGDVLAD